MHQQVNADRFLITELSATVVEQAASVDSIRLMAVADGVGRELLGQRASHLVLGAISDYARQSPSPVTDEVQPQLVQQLSAAIGYCQSQLRADAEQQPEFEGMGTTLTLACVRWPDLYLLHVGDSRCYLQRGTELQRLTTDHTVAEKMVETGVLRRNEASRSRWSNVLWNTINSSAREPQPDFCRHQLQLGDRVLLCTDGLTKHVSDRELSEVLSQDLSATDLCRQLVDAANVGGGTDNITVVVARLLPPAPQSQQQIRADSPAAESPGGNRHQATRQRSSKGLS